MFLVFNSDHQHRLSLAAQHLKQCSQLKQQSGKMNRVSDGHGGFICRAKGSIYSIVLTHKPLGSHDSPTHGGAHGALMPAIHALMTLYTCHRLRHRIRNSKGACSLLSCNGPWYCGNVDPSIGVPPQTYLQNLCID